MSESDIQILKIALYEHLPKLKESGLDLNQDYYHPSITKEEVVKHLHDIDLHQFAEILSESKGIG